MHVLPKWENKHLLPPHINDKRGVPEMTSRLVARVKRVTKLRQSNLRACHHAEEFTLRWICPLGRWDKMAYAYPRLASPSHDATNSKILTSFIVVVEVIISSSYVVLTDGEVFQLVSRLFDKSPMTVLHDSMPTPYYSDNPPPLVEIFIFFSSISD
jgi:hypothetical protein